MNKQKNIHIAEDSYLEEVMNINNKGKAYFSEGKYDRALQCFEESLELRLRMLGKNHLLVADSYNNIGNTFYYKRLYDKALVCHLESKNIKTLLLGAEDIALADTYNGIGICYDAQGFYSKALGHYNKSLDLRLRHLEENHPSVAQSFNNLGLCYYSMGTYDNALIYLRKALQIRQTHFGEQHWSIAQTYLNIGVCYFSKEEYDEALYFYQKSLKIKEVIYGKGHSNIAIVLDNIGVCYQQKGSYDRALQYHYDVLKIRKSILEDHPSLAITYSNIANCLLQKDLFEEALSYFQNSLRIVIPEFNPQNLIENPPIQQYMDAHVLWEILQYKAACFQRMHLQGKTKSTNYGQWALDTYQLASKLMGQLRRGYKAESTHLTLAEKAHQMYDTAIDTAIVNGAQELAFSFAEQGKGMMLLSSLKDIDARLAANIPEKWLNEADDLRVRLTELDSEIHRERCKTEANRNKGKLRNWRNQHFDYQRKYEALIEKLEREYPNYFQLKYDVRNLAVKELQESLDAKTAIVEFFVGRKQSYLFAVGQDFICTEILAISESELQERVEDLIEAIYAENIKEYKELARELYDILLKKCLENDLFEGIQNLHIIPDGDLSFLPFETLLTEEKASTKYAELPYLIADYSISYHYSSTLWHYGRNKQEVEEQPPLSFVGFAPVYEHQNNCYETLHHSVSEIEGIKKAFEAKEQATTLFLHSDASKENFKQHVGNYQYAHIAAHAFSPSYFGQNEDYSSDGIVFSFEGEEAKGILSMAEIYNLSLNVDLMVLSCCDSGIGKVAKGEGVMAINRGFLYAGAKNVIYTLFKVYDRQSAELMQYLYQEILERNGYSNSLQAAKMKMIQQQYAPKYWSGFVHIGE